MNRENARNVVGRKVRSSCLSFVMLLTVIATQIALSQDLKSVSSTLANAIAASGRRTIAVVDFTDLEGNVTELGRFLAEDLSIHLVTNAKGFEVIERNQLKVILQEHRLSTTGLIDPQTAKKLGQIAGADALVTGTITPLGDSVRLSVKVLDTTTAKMITATSTDVPRTKAVEELLARGIGASPVQRSEEPMRQSSHMSANQPTLQTESYRLVAESLRKKVDHLYLVLRVESVGQDAVHVGLYSCCGSGAPCTLIDEKGELWQAEGDTAGLQGGGVDLQPGATLTTRFTFVPRGDTAGKTFNLTCREATPKVRPVFIQGISVQ